MTPLPILALGLMVPSAATQPAGEPTTTTSSRPVTSRGRITTSGDPAVDRILERLERRGDAVRSLTSELRADFLDVVADDKQSKLGKIWFRRDKPNPKFKVIYEKSLYDDIVTEDKHEYLFDGRWLIEKHDKSRTYQEREIVAEGEKIEPFRIGKGPFPLPFGQKKAEILKHFLVTRVRRSPKDPKNTDHLKLVPRKTSAMAEKYVELHFYIDRKIELPVRVVAHQHRPGGKEVDEIVSVTFTDLKINPDVPDKVLMIPKPKERDWHFSKESLPANPPPPTERQPPR